MQQQEEVYHIASLVGLVPAQNALPNIEGSQLLLLMEGSCVHQAATAGAPPCWLPP